MKFWILWGWDALIAAVFLFFFFWGLADGTVSAFNIALWTAVLADLGLVVGGSLWLRTRGRVALAVALLLVLAIPGAFLALFFLAADPGAPLELKSLRERAHRRVECPPMAPLAYPDM